MKLAFCLFRYFPYSGLSRVFLSIISEMACRGHQIDAYVYEWQGEFPKAVNINLLPSGKWTNHNRDATYYKTVRPFLVDGNYDAVIGFNKMPELDYYYAGDFCYLDRISTKFNPFYRLTPRHHHFARFEKEVFKPQSKTVLLMLSESEKKIYKQNYHPAESRFVILPPALDKENVIFNNTVSIRNAKREELGLLEDQKLVLFVGSGFRTKGLDRAIHALAQLPIDQKEKTKLLVVGHDNHLPYKAMSTKLGVAGAVEFVGGRFDVPELMLAADMLIHPAYREAAGNVLLEAIASGLPVLTTDGCGYCSHISKADAGIVLTSPVTQKQISEAFSKMLSLNAKLWSKNGRQYASQEDLYAMPQFVADLIESNAPILLQRKSQRTAKLISQKSLRYNFTYRSEFQTPSLLSLMDQPDQFLLDNSIETIKHDKTTTVAVIHCGNEKLVLKRYNTKGIWHFFKRSVRKTRASICWNFAHRLLENGLNTPLPIGYRENRVGLFRARSYYVAKYSTGITLLNYLSGGFNEAKTRVVVELMNQFFAVMQTQRLAHGDLKASNFLIKDGKLEVLDLDSMRYYQSSQFHEHKLLRDKRRFLRNWNVNSKIHQYLAQNLESKDKIESVSEKSVNKMLSG